MLRPRLQLHRQVRRVPGFVWLIAGVVAGVPWGLGLYFAYATRVLRLFGWGFE